VRVLAYDSVVTADEITIGEPLPITGVP